MSGFDDNPFADPFAEPSIQQATKGSAPNGLEEYDPFGSQSATNTTTTTAGNNGNPPTYVQPTVGGGVGTGGQPAVVTPTPNNPPAYTPSAQQQVTTAEFQELKRRQEELEKKAEELARKEEELRNAGSAGARQDNWPPLPSSFPVGPCFYQDINVDIPLEFQKIVRMLYYLWMFHALMLLLNILGGLGIFIMMNEGSTFGLAILYFFLFTPFSYVCWFRPVYKAFRNDSSFNFMVFFFVFSFQLIVSIINAIGIPRMGSCGWVSVSRSFSLSHIGLGVFMILVALAASFQSVAMAYALLRVHRIYRSTGASFAKAQVEFSQGVMRNEHVQNVTANAAEAAVRNQFGSTAAGGNSSSPRF
ncbi:secretory carrier-associated membrane protein 1-like isoform X4 [Homarus americanus]|uniref:secretory carrier-associated membrane protein 1-like isoform X4 n=1 Tax=Homarus americanus TaxID=6706 RepID=UPI001C496487|nr:secretory carrier-associated membrane protein 1-like isoform X4 [Homarus americanus]